MKRYIKSLLPAAMLILSMASCTEINNYPDGSIDFDEIFRSEKMTAGWLNNCYVPMCGSQYGSAFGSNKSFLDAATDNAQDVDDIEGGVMAQWNNGLATVTNNPLTGLDKWGLFYQGIGNCNILINNIDKAYILEEANRERYRAEAYGLRAFYYLQLAKIYGGVPIVLDQVDDSPYNFSNVKPATFSQVVKQVLADCQQVLDCPYIEWRSGASDKDLNRINKAIVSAIMSEAALYAASPLNNDGTISWADAAEICKKALNDCVANGYELFTKAPSAAGNANLVSCTPYDFLFQQKPDASGSNEKESILSISQCNVWQYNTAPIISGHVRAGSCPSQELIDSYETTDGVAPILGYADDQHLKPIINPEAKLYDEKNPYANRDPRLKATVYYNGAPAHLQASRPQPTIYTGEGSRYKSDMTSTLYTRTGYYLHKYFNITSNRTALQDGYYRIYRLAELYLNYAEAAAEAATGSVPKDAIDAINKVRARVGMPAIPASISKDDFRTRVRNERRVELAFEDHRFFDVRRWKTLDQSKVVTGMRPVGEEIKTVALNEEGGYLLDEKGQMVEVEAEKGGVEYRTCKGYDRYVAGKREAVADKFLRCPVPVKEAAALKQATGLNFQNPGW